ALRERLGSTLLRAGRAAEAHRHLHEAAEAETDVRRRADLQALAVQATTATAGAEAAVAELVTVLESWPPLAEEPARMRLEAALGVTRQFVPSQRRQSVEHLRQFEGLTGETADERTLLALLAQRGRHQNEPQARVADYARRALGDGALFDDAARGESLVPWTLGMMAAIAADVVTETRREVERARTRIVRGGSPVDYAMAANAAQVLAWRVGDVTATETECEAVLAAVAHEPVTPEVLSLRVTAVHFACYVAMEHRDLAAAKAALAELDAGTEGVRVIPLIWLHEIRARVSLAEDDPHGALQHLATLQREIEQAGVDPAGLAWRLPAAIAHSRLGRDDEARALLATQVDNARAWGSPTEIGSALRVAARFDPDPEARAAQLAEAVVVLAGAHDRLEHAKALADQAESWRTQGRRTDSRELLTEAADLAHACGAAALERRIAGALQALGDRPRRTTAPGPESLTASERRVATLAVIGRSNRDIAQELFVSPKTVENHLGRVYTKLGIGSRRELAGALG
ncbi:helix-turn-helix transcriptional regulator, partial [Nocardioides sp.]|uniref:helix-turn-helix transcriptional regulator n=1 Tax=Nocardioides sp. TaxID=35761 RepID=UPI00271E62B9